MKEQLFILIAGQLGLDETEITLESNFRDDLGTDSLDIVELVMELEDRFNIEIPDSETEKLFTVGDVFKYLEANINDTNI